MAGLFLGGLITALTLVVVGSLLRAPLPLPVRVGAATGISLLLIVREFGWVRFPLPQNARQVPQHVTMMGVPGAVQFGTEMGTGMRTFSPTGLPHLLAVAILLLASWPHAILAGLGFAAGRALMVLSFVRSHDHHTADRAFALGITTLRWVFAALILPTLTVLLIG